MPKKVTNNLPLRKIIGANIVKLRKSHGLNHQDLAAILGLTRPSIYNLEAGKHSLTTDCLMVLVSYFRCKFSDILPDEKTYKMDLAPVNKRLAEVRRKQEKISAIKETARKKIKDLRNK